ncbi:Scr1 family TA system antitoxin-like transcriptional regulator [Streptomyces sp. NPDC087532]|uniref:Scr1 family TA system antitoxin-like transcriptional regulator n=1 Tax=Streptomyces sp. NPDC087532 TaxID=3365795 RepID=UPI0037F4DEF5
MRHQAWREQVEYPAEASDRPGITLHVLPFSAGPHGLMSTDAMFLRLPDGGLHRERRTR